VPSNEAQSSPFSPDKGGARRSVSPSKFETLAAPSPTKFGVPNRKLRNQPASRIHDIEFAAEISTSLITQVRNLQALLSEREEELKDVKSERSQLEIEAEGFQQRLKTLDESESRYKDENWNLETQIHELIAGQKEAAEREKKLTQTVNIIQAERNATQRELEEVKDNLAKQDEKHSAEIKNLEIELGTSRRTATVFETERSVLQRKVEELTGQNQELAKAFSALQRGRALEREAPAGGSEEDSNSAPDHNTPEHSPPPSPMKPTPRHSALESETLKTSLGHAQRTIQTLRTNIHREKTEKLELKRMLQDARDEVEKLRSDPNPAPKRSRKAELREAKKPSFRLNQLGVSRSSRTEVVEDPEWEDQSEIPSPSMLSRHASNLRLPMSTAPVESSSDHFETANETSDAAFETAQERGTETEDFQTGVEEMSDDNDTATETESGPARGANSIKRPPPLPPHHSSNHYSFDSTASTSSEDDDYPSFSSDIKTPTSGPRMRMRVSRNSLARRSRHFNEEPAMQGSPSGLPTNNAQVTPGGQSLFAELNEFDNSDEDSCTGPDTPSRRSIRSVTPATPGSVARGRASPPPEVPAMPKIMVDSGMMTEPMDLRSGLAILDRERGYEVSEDSERPMSMESVIRPRQFAASTQWLGDGHKDGDSSRPASAISYSNASVQHEWNKLFPSAAAASSIASIQTQIIEPLSEPERTPSPPPLSVSSILSEQTEPITELVEPPVLSLASLVSEHVEPVAEPEPALPKLSTPLVLFQAIEPVSEPEIPLPALSVPVILSQDIEPVSEPEIPLPEPPTLSMPAIVSQYISPVAEPEPPLPEPQTLSVPVVVSQDIEPTAPTPVALSFSTVHIEEVEPVVELDTPPPSPIALSCSAIFSEQVEPVELPAPIVAERSEPKVVVPVPLPLSLSSIASEHVEPQDGEPISPIKLSVSSIAMEEVEPFQEPETPMPSLALAPIQTLDVVPYEAPASPLIISGVRSWDIEPLDEPEVLPPSLSLSDIEAQNVEPIELVDEPEVPPPSLSLSGIEAQNVEPIEPEEPKVAPLLLSLAGIQSLHSEPVEARTPKRNAFIIPRDIEAIVNGEEDAIQARDAPASSSGPESAPAQVQIVPTTDQGAQTALTSEAIDQMIREKLQPPGIATLERSQSMGSMGTPSTVRIHRPRQESFDTPLRHKGTAPDSGADVLEALMPRRPGSSASGMASIYEVPPLPANHKEAIEAARTGSSQGGQGTIGAMGPPLFPASSLKPQNSSLRPRTPTGSRRPTSPISVSGRATPTPRVAGRPGVTPGHADVHDMQSLSRATLRSRKSSISSFTSEVDTRFNMHHANGFDPQGFGPNTDPRMIQAITQTMIGEYLWKYTRKAGRGEMSENRHRRYFWVHPYTRTLYWSDRDPSSAGRSELRAKSVQIEAVRVVADDNPMPPGLHRKSLIIVSPGRSIKFTCTTGQRHETWFNALSYLLLRTTDEGHKDAEELAGYITQEDVDEFNPSTGKRPTNDSRAPPSLSSYNSQSARQSPTMDISMSVPTLTPSRSKASQGRQSYGTLSRISGYWKENKISGTFGSMRSRSVQGRHSALGIYETNDLHDSAEDVREMIERQDREADRLENVRACCDGKHDVGTLTNSAKKGRHSVTGFRSPTPSSSAPTPVGTVRSRA
jgi:septal ring factor EnvC (AmiA/AmiB activator)